MLQNPKFNVHNTKSPPKKTPRKLKTTLLKHSTRNLKKRRSPFRNTLFHTKPLRALMLDNLYP